MSPSAGRREERCGDLQAAFLRHGKARARGADVGPRAAGKLAARRRLAADRLGDLLEVDAEHVVQEEGGALQRRQALERQHQRQRDVVDLVLRRLDDRFRQPRPDIGLAPVPRRFQLVEAEARRRRGAETLPARAPRLDRRRASAGRPPGPRPPRPRPSPASDRRRGQSRTQRIEAGRGVWRRLTPAIRPPPSLRDRSGPRGSRLGSGSSR